VDTLLSTLLIYKCFSGKSDTEDRFIARSCDSKIASIMAPRGSIRVEYDTRSRRKSLLSPNVSRDDLKDDVHLMAAKLVREANENPNGGPPCLVTQEEVDEFRRYPFVTKGYRANHGICDCLLSTIGFHNETCNIWTHLLPLLLSIVYVAYHYEDALSPLPMGAYCAALCGVFASFSCLGSSAIYHTWNALPKGQHDFLLQIDMSGVIFNQVGNSITVIYFGLIGRQEELMIFYFCYMGFFTMIGLKLANIGAHPEYGVAVRNFGISSFILLGLLPLIHTVFIATAELWDILFWFVISYPIAGSGLGVYLSRFPECFTPYFVDNFALTSHSLWHIWVAVQNFICLQAVIALCYHYQQTLH
jgi:adiponectin receptor